MSSSLRNTPHADPLTLDPPTAPFARPVNHEPGGAFDLPVAPGGYAWWYFDALSDDGERACVAIFFIGSVFSPTYAARAQRGERPPAEEHLGVNLALYDRGRQVGWVMSEYGSRELKARERGALGIARSSIERAPDGRLCLTIDDRSAPFMASLMGVGRRVYGRIELEPMAQPVEAATLPSGGGHAHRWSIAVPRARVRVDLPRPGFRFEGVGYHDTNCGEGRLEAAFARWSWARFHDVGRTTVLYAMRERGGAGRALLVDVADEGGGRVAEPVTLCAEGEQRAATWGFRLPRRFAADGPRGAWACRPGRVLEPSPFYARYLCELDAPDRPSRLGLGEHLDLERFAGRGVQFLLRFKTRRVS
jgi:carotenoid 1,2-hydratase